VKIKEEKKTWKPPNLEIKISPKLKCKIMPAKLC